VTNFNAILLGLVQGLTEFLPVSSSGHLVIIGRLLDVDAPGIIFEVMVHVGTALAVCVFLRKEIREVFAGLIRLAKAAGRRSSLARLIRSDEGARLGLLVAVGSVPTALMGLCLSDVADRLFESILPAGLGLIVTGLVLRIGQRHDRGGRGVAEVGWLDAAIVGVAQGLAIAPGVSRSGATVACSLTRGMSPEVAARLSFLMSVPVILGAAVFELVKHTPGSDAAVTWLQLALGASVAAVSGFVAVSIFMRLINQRRLAVFSWYCFALGGATLVIWAI
jgi:undecaprenyl-diphosphatase